MFPSDVKQEAMIACGRRCCLCNRYCGVGMECHHIIPKAEGGEDVFSNCIPLCFDCHAGVGHYRPQHPKGTKFSGSELCAHRDRWYHKIATGISEGAPADHLELDRGLFRRICAMLGGTAAMTHYRDHDYAETYPREIEERLCNILHYVKLPEVEFFDLQVATAFADLNNALINYKKATNNRIWWEVDGTAGIPREWRRGEHSEPQRFWDARDAMNKEATEVWGAFCAFVKEGRRTLKIEPEPEPLR